MGLYHPVLQMTIFQGMQCCSALQRVAVTVFDLLPRDAVFEISSREASNQKSPHFGSVCIIRVVGRQEHTSIGSCHSSRDLEKVDSFVIRLFSAHVIAVGRVSVRLLCLTEKACRPVAFRRNDLGCAWRRGRTIRRPRRSDMALRKVRASLPSPSIIRRSTARERLDNRHILSDLCVLLFLLRPHSCLGHALSQALAV